MDTQSNMPYSNTNYKKERLEQKEQFFQAGLVGAAGFAGSSIYLLKNGYKAVGYFVVALIAALLLGYLAYMFLDIRDDKNDLLDESK